MVCLCSQVITLEMQVLTLEKIQEVLSGKNLSEAARATGIHPSMMWRIVNEKDQNPKYKTLKKLSDYVEAME